MSSSGPAGGSGSSGSSASSSSSGVDAGTVDCSATLPSGGNTSTGSNINGTADGLNYGIWATGGGGSITVFPNAHAFSASWNNISDFLAHIGLDFDGSKSYTAYGTIDAQFSERSRGPLAAGRRLACTGGRIAHASNGTSTKTRSTVWGEAAPPP